MIGKPYLINLACTGLVPTRALSPHVPLNHNEIVDEVGRALELGVQMFHLHARDADGKHTGDPEPYGRMIEAIRELPGGRHAILCVTTSGRYGADVESRSRVLELDRSMKPDMASLTLSSLNFVQQASMNEPATIRELARRMKSTGIMPELEVFDLGMANFLHVLRKEGLLGDCGYVNLLLGNIAGAQMDPLHYAALRTQIPPAYISAVAGIGGAQLSANVYGLLHADGVRVGLEDSIWYDHARTRLASNRDLVQRVIRLAIELERPLARVEDLRKQLKLPSERHA